MPGQLHYDYLIIGGGIAGVTAAETIREESPASSIGVFSGEAHLFYSRVLLPSYLKKKIGREKLFLRSAEDFTKRRVDLHLSSEVVSLDEKRREVRLKNGLVFAYGKVLIAAGGKVKPWGEEAHQRYIYRLQTLDDADRLIKDLSFIRSPLVVGSSFISLEFLEIFILSQSSPILLSRDPYFFARILDPKGGEILRRNFERHGIALHFNDSLSKVMRKERGLEVLTEQGAEFPADALAAGIGLDRNLEFLKSSAVRMGKHGVLTNEFLETSEPDIFAAGDVAEFQDVIFGERRILGNWTNAFLQGKRAGLNMAGLREPFKNVSTYSITNLGMQLTAIGECGRDSDTIVRLDEGRDQYERLFLRGGVLVGAALINRFQDKAHLAKLIETRTNVEEYRSQLLAGFQFDVQSVPLLT